MKSQLIIERSLFRVCAMHHNIQRNRNFGCAILIIAAIITWSPTAVAAPLLRIYDTGDNIQLILPDGTNSGALSELRTDANGIFYEFLQYTYDLPKPLKSVPPGVSSNNSFEYYLTEPGSGTSPGIWSDTIDIAWCAEGGNCGTNTVIITFYSDLDMGRPEITPGGMPTLTVEENWTFAVSQDFDVGAEPFLYVEVNSTPEPSTGALAAVGIAGMIFSRRWKCLA